MTRVTVVGGGVVGLTSALAVARAGHSVWCVRERPGTETVSGVAGGLWFPYHVEPRDRVTRWGLVALERFVALAADPATGVRLAEGVVVDRRAEPDHWWTAGLPEICGVRAARPDELPADATGGVVARLPLVDMTTHLAWLEAECASAGVELAVGRVGALDELADDLVVVAAGMGSPHLTGEPPLEPGRGQVARVANPGIDRWLVDDEHPDGMTYVLPHERWVVCGGTDESGADEAVDAALGARILARCAGAVPALAGARVLAHAVGLRPLAPSVRLQRHGIRGKTVVTNYGHGGAGVTLSWGCAAEVAALLLDPT